MIKIKANGKKVGVLLNKLSEIHVWKGIQILEFLDGKDINSLNLNVKKLIIELLSDINVNLLEDESINLLFDKIELFKEQEIYFPSAFKLNGVCYGFVDLNTLTVKELADIEFFMKGESLYTNIHKVIPILFRKIIRKNITFKDILINKILQFKYKNIRPLSVTSYEVEEYKEDKEFENTIELFYNKLSFDFVYGCLSKIAQYKEQLRKEFMPLFKTDEQIEDEKNDEYYDPTTPEENTFFDMWGLYATIVEISKDIFERERWYKKQVKELYTYLVYIKQKSLQEKMNTKNV